MKRTLLNGRWYKVTATFTDIDLANLYMQEHPKEGVLKVRREGNVERIILAKIKDNGRRKINYRNCLVVRG